MSVETWAEIQALLFDENGGDGVLADEDTSELDPVVRGAVLPRLRLMAHIVRMERARSRRELHALLAEYYAPLAAEKRGGNRENGGENDENVVVFGGGGVSALAAAFPALSERWRQRFCAAASEQRRTFPLVVVAKQSKQQQPKKQMNDRPAPTKKKNDVVGGAGQQRSTAAAVAPSKGPQLPIPVFVVTLTTGSTRIVELDTSPSRTTVGQLKALIAEKLDYPDTSQFVLFTSMGKSLPDGHDEQHSLFLADYGIGRQSTVHMKLAHKRNEA